MITDKIECGEGALKIDVFRKYKKSKDKEKDMSNETFKHSIKKSFILYSLVPITIIALIIYGGVIISFLSWSYNDNRRVNSSIADIINDEFTSYKDDLAELCCNKQVIDILLYKSGRSSEIYETIYNMVNERKIKSIFNMYDSSGKCIVTNSVYEIEDSEKNISYIWNRFGKMSAYPDEAVMINDKIQYHSNIRSIYTIGKAVCDDEGKIIGFVEFDILENEISRILSYKEDKDIVVTDKYNNNIINTNSALLDSIGKFKSYEHEKNSQVIRRGILNNDIYVNTIKSTGFMKKFFITGGIALVFIFAIIFAVMIYVANKISIKNTKSIDELLKGLEYVQNGNFTQRLSIDTNDEFKTVAGCYNVMVDKVRELMIKNEEEVKRAALAQLKHLESQFNPHFLFNTLEMLRYMIKTNDKNAEKVILAMAGILRYSLDSNIRTTILKTDLKYIEDYLFIQKLRFENKFSYEINIDKALEKAVIPKLILQPVIENSVKYGFNQKDSMMIKIKAEECNGEMMISVIDNGDGIKKEEMKQIENQLKSEDDDSSHIGLYNVQKRIQLIYGERYGIEIKSDGEAGTSVFIRIPENGGS